MENKFKIPNSYYLPQGKVHLLTPQHWGKHYQLNEKNKRYHGTLSQTTSDLVTLIWNDQNAKLTIPLSKESNVPTFHMAPGYNNYFAFCTEAGIDTLSDQNDPLIYSLAIETEDEDKMLDQWNKVPRITLFYDRGMDIEKRVLPASEGDQSVSNQMDCMAKFLRLYQRLGHIYHSEK